ncbi:MAG: hypothetical protein U1F16_14740 [Turneriella sp.]
MKNKTLLLCTACISLSTGALTAQTQPAANNYAGTHIALSGAYGLSNPNASFSTFLPGTGPDFRSASEFAASITYYWNEENGFNLSVGSASRDIAFKDSTASGLFPMQFLDLRAGYRLQPNALFIEFGILGAVKTKDVPITIATSSVSASGGIVGVNQKSYAAIYAMLGIYLPVSNNIFLQAAGKVDYGVTPAVDGNWPYYTTSGAQYKTEKVTLVPFNMGVSLGIGFRF